MTNYQSPLPDYNPDGSMNPHVRDRFRNRGLTEEEIDRIESVKMRHIRVDKEQAEYEKQWKKEVEEGRKKRKAEREAERKLGIEPGFKILYSSPDRIDPKSLNPAQRRAYEMSGLTTEELLSQGYIDIDDLSGKDQRQEEDDSGWYVNPNPPPEIPF